MSIVILCTVFSGADTELTQAKVIMGLLYVESCCWHSPSAELLDSLFKLSYHLEGASEDLIAS